MKINVMGEFFKTLGEMLGNGVPLVASLKKCSRLNFLSEQEEFINLISENLKAGMVFSECLNVSGLNNHFVDLIRDAETKGILDEKLPAIGRSILNGDYVKYSGSDEFIPDINRLSSEDNPKTDVATSVNQFILNSLEKNAGELHLIPGIDNVCIKLRINGVLVEQETFDKKYYSGIVARIKYISEMDVAEKRLPQDGRMIFNYSDRKIDIRISCVPTVTGEKVTAIFLDNKNVVVELDKIFDEESKNKILSIANRPYGMILITGMTGSGKTTTCYSIVNEYMKRNLNIATIEDPVEYIFNGATQIGIDNSIGLTFPRAIKAVLRSMADVIFIGEFRDSESIDLAVLAARTGHIVIGQFHSSSAYELIEFLIKSEHIDHSVLGTVLNGVISQALVRKLCECKRKYTVNSELNQQTGIVEAYTETGCEKCLNSGYRGRTSVNEIIELTHEMKSAIAVKDLTKIRQLINGSLKENALKLVKDGITSIEEIERVFGK